MSKAQELCDSLDEMWGVSLHSFTRGELEELKKVIDKLLACSDKELDSVVETDY